MYEARAFASLPRPDVIWSSVGTPMAPYLWAQWGRLRRPLILDQDGTLEQAQEWSWTYKRKPPRRGIRRRALYLHQALLRRSVTLFTPWSTWAADALRREGIASERIRVLPPGVDLSLWAPPTSRSPVPEGLPRILFVGNDFERKGGNMLLDVFSSRFRERAVLDLVTHADIAPRPGVEIHRAEPNSARLRAVYHNADLFVLPTRAEYFGIASIEAMAAGLPTLISDVGAARDIVAPGKTGWLIKPEAAHLAALLEVALADRSRLRVMGKQARRIASERFDGARNNAAIVDLVIELHQQYQA